jgi:hypothetical protein
MRINRLRRREFITLLKIYPPSSCPRNAPQVFLLGLSKQALADEFVHCRRRTFHAQSAGKLRASAAEKLPRCARALTAVTDGARVRPRCVTARGWSPEPARPAPPERVNGQSRSGLDYMLVVVKHQQHLPPYASVVTTTESEVTEITET